MPPKAKQMPKVNKVEALRDEIVEILEEYLDELNRVAETNPGEHNVEPIRNAQTALRLFKPDVPNVYA